MSHGPDATQPPDTGTLSAEVDAIDLTPVVEVIHHGRGRYRDDPTLAANFLQRRIGYASDSKLHALASIARQIDAQIYKPFLGLVLFIWIRDHLCSSPRYGEKAQGIFEDLVNIYRDHKSVFYGPHDDGLILCILAGRGLMEAKALERAVSNFRLEPASAYGSCKTTFRKAYVKSVLRGEFTPVDQHKVLALLLIPMGHLYDDYTPTGFETAAATAKSVLKLMGSSGTALRISDVPKRGDKDSWCLLGKIFNAACRFVAQDPRVELLRERVEGPYERVAFPVRFLFPAIMCFNEGMGWKISRFLPTTKRWDVCQNGDNPEHKHLCIVTGGEIEALACSNTDNRLSISQRMGLVALSSQKWDSPMDRAELAQTTNWLPLEEIEPTFVLAEDLGGRRFGSEFQLKAFHALARMTEDQRGNLKSHIKPLFLSLLEFTGDDSFLREKMLSILQSHESGWYRALQRAQTIMKRRYDLRTELKENGGYPWIEIDDLLLAAGSSIDRLSETRKMALETRGLVKSPVIVLRELCGHNVKWNEVAGYFHRLAEVVYDSLLLSHHTLQIIRTNHNKREELCANLIDAALSSHHVNISLNDTTRLAHLNRSQKTYVLSALRRVPREERHGALEIIMPMLERLKWEHAKDGVDDVLRVPQIERVSCRNQIMQSHERPDIENVMRSHSIHQTKRAIRQVMKLAQPDAMMIDYQKILDSIEVHMFGYFPRLAPEEARRLLRRASRASSSRDIDVVVSRLSEEIRTKPQSNDFQTLLSVRAGAPEIANAWRTLAGDRRRQDLSEPLKFTTAKHLNLVHIGTLAAMVWRLIDTFPEHASRQRILDPSLVHREQADMRFTFLMALAQCIDESEQQLVYNYGLSQRLCVALQGLTRYSSIVVDCISPPQRFTQILQEFHEDNNDEVDKEMIVKLQQVLFDGATREERSWYHAELVKYCSLTDWPSPPDW